MFFLESVSHVVVVFHGPSSLYMLGLWKVFEICDVEDTSNYHEVLVFIWGISVIGGLDDSEDRLLTLKLKRLINDNPQVIELDILIQKTFRLDSYFYAEFKVRKTELFQDVLVLIFLLKLWVVLIILHILINSQLLL